MNGWGLSQAIERRARSPLPFPSCAFLFHEHPLGLSILTHWSNHLLQEAAVPADVDPLAALPRHAWCFVVGVGRRQLCPGFGAWGSELSMSEDQETRGKPLP